MATTRSQLATTKGAETRDRILAAALDLFRDRGFDQTTMRDIAAGAGVATGAAYYYFRSKEEVVMAFYTATSVEMRELIPPELARTRDLKKRLRRILELKLEQLEPHRPFLAVLFRGAIDPASPLSPFAPETQEIRDETIAWFREAIATSSEMMPKELAPTMPSLLWLYEMGIILFWLSDRSPKQRRTTRLLDGTLDLMIRSLRLLRLPLLGPVRRQAASLLRDIGVAVS
jgi:AcrR family transcriptional regulator